MKVHLARLFTALLLGGAISNAVASVDEGVAAYEQKNYALALEKFRTEANAGNAKAQAWLGFIYDNGQGAPKDDKQAVAWYRKAADQGDADAQNNLGFSYESGQGTPRNIMIAYALYNVSAGLDASSDKKAPKTGIE